MNRSFSPYIYADETQCVETMLRGLPWDENRARRIETHAQDVVRKVRARKRPPGQLEAFLQGYSLSSDEGIALMCLAEALLRIPDRKTMNALIRDKMAAATWARNKDVQDWVVKSAGFGLLVTHHTLDSAIARIGEPFIREAMLKAMRIMGQQFVIGTDIENAVQKSQPYVKKGYRMSYDMLGEGARTAIDAERYFESYMNAIRYIGARGDHNEPNRSSISVKLSALHPRYSYAQSDRCVLTMTARLSALAHEFAKYNVGMTVDAEEVDRLQISLDIIEGVMADPALRHWEGFGLAVQAYSKRGFYLIDHLIEQAKSKSRLMQVRLVKGAYWDSEIKRAQVQGLSDYPVFTRKVNTDLSYLAGAHKLLNAKGYIYPLFGTHNAHTACAIVDIAKEAGAAFEFQRLHGMGEALSDVLLENGVARAGIYAPVGPHEDLLAYLVRRLLENGANTSFVNHLLNDNTPPEDIVTDPVRKVRDTASVRHPKIPMPKEMYKNEGPNGRLNSAGIDLSDPQVVNPLLRDASQFYKGSYDAPALIGGKFYKDTSPVEIKNPANTSDTLGRMWPGNAGLVDKAFRVSSEAFAEWNDTTGEHRADILERFADMLEINRAEFVGLCVREAGKTIPDAIAEIREAVDFCRYYANRGRAEFAAGGHVLPGPTGESNILSLHGRGTFVCISPWNFPLAIFIGQVTAALMAGNCVIAKPAEQTPITALRAVQMLHKAGVPVNVLHYMPGDGYVGAALVAHAQTAGVAFTGSTAVAREINITLAKKEGPIVPLIAETGGQNAMLVDSSALPEQVVDDVILSAFGSAGQRCSSLRILLLQDDIADRVIRLLMGAVAELRLGPPGELSSDIGPVIDEEAYAKLQQHREYLKGFGKLVCEAPLDEVLKNQGYFFAPCAWELNNLSGLKNEVFGPILHIVRYRRDELNDIIDQINATGFGLTLGVHTRINAFDQDIVARVRAGNAYVNRSMIGAVVGTQPFGGQGLSGTGPKAGGPHYLPRFATEKVVSINTTAAGGNTTLVSLTE